MNIVTSLITGLVLWIKACRLARIEKADRERFEERKKFFAAHIASNSFGVQLARSM